MSDSARKEAEVLIDPNAQTGAIVSALKALAEEAANRHSSYQDQLAAIKGRIGGQPAAGAAGKIKVFNPATGMLE